MSWQTFYMWKYTLVQIHTVPANSKVFLNYVFGWDWLLLYPLAFNLVLSNLQKATWPLFGELVYLNNSAM